MTITGFHNLTNESEVNIYKNFYKCDKKVSCTQHNDLKNTLKNWAIKGCIKIKLLTILLTVDLLIDLQEKLWFVVFRRSTQDNGFMNICKNIHCSCLQTSKSNIKQILHCAAASCWLSTRKDKSSYIHVYGTSCVQL